MKSPLKLNGIILGAFAGLAAIGIACATGEMFQPKAAAAPGAGKSPAVLPAGTLAQQGRALFMINCAHCHGSDARDDEGPDLHDVTKSDARIASLIKNGIKGEMPKFGAKLADTDVEALVAFIRSLD